MKTTQSVHVIVNCRYLPTGQLIIILSAVVAQINKQQKITDQMSTGRVNRLAAQGPRCSTSFKNNYNLYNQKLQLEPNTNCKRSYAATWRMPLNNVQPRH